LIPTTCGIFGKIEVIAETETSPANVFEDVFGEGVLEEEPESAIGVALAVFPFLTHRTYKITWNPLEQNLSCSCQKFETFDILCRHALKNFDVLDIKLIPDEYIIKRWRRDAKDEKNFTKKEIELDIRLEYVDRYRALCPKYIQLVNEACETEEGFNILNAAVVDLKKRLCDAKSCQANAEEDNIRISTTLVKKEDQPCVSITVGPKGIKKKGISRNKKHRLKS
jgi:hypothetical protein